MSSMAALSAAGALTGVSKIIAQSSSVPKSGLSSEKNNLPINNMEYRKLGNLGVSAIGLGCLPMVGYYGGKYDKKDMIALIQRAYDKGVTFSIQRKCMVLIPVKRGWAKPSLLFATK